MTAYIEIITASAPHIYHSALVSTPKTSVVRKLYESYAQPFARVVCGLPASWDSNTAATKYPQKIARAVWSPCSRLIAVAFQDSMLVDILDSVTLQKLQTLKLRFERKFANSATALGFSPDSLMLTRFSHHGRVSEWKSFVVTWDLQTGGVISTIERSLGESLAGRAYITYSTNGKAVGILHQCFGNTAISIYNVASGVYTHDVYHSAPAERLHKSTLCQPDTGHSWCAIWTHGEFLRFTTVTPTGATIWEVKFIPGATPTEVGSLFFPENIKPTVLTGQHTPALNVTVQFHPALHRLALLGPKTLGGLLVWDAQELKPLLHYANINFFSKMAFSSDGRFFACPTAGLGIYLWKESPTGYVLHGILAPTARYITPLLSPNGEFLFTYDDSVIRLWHTNSFTTAPSSAPLQAQRIENFVLDFLPDRLLAVVARQKDNTVMVLDLKSGVSRWTIDTGMVVYGLRVIGETIAVIGEEEVTVWSWPGGIVFPGTRTGVEDSVLTIPFRRLGDSVIAASISFDFGYIAVMAGPFRYVQVCNTSTRQHDIHSLRLGSALWFLPDSHDIGLVPDGNRGEVLIINTQGTVLKKMTLGDIEYGQWGCPYGSSRGYKFTNDGWVIGPSGKRLLMLPPHWQADPEGRVWSGQFLALLHGALPELVILELEPSPVLL